MIINQCFSCHSVLLLSYLFTSILAFTALCIYHNWVTRNLEPYGNTIVNYRQHAKYYTDSLNNLEEDVHQNNLKYVNNLAEAKKMIHTLENRIRNLEINIPRTFPAVKFLNYHNRKRILVSVIIILHDSFTLKLKSIKKIVISFQITGGAGFVGSHLVDYLMMEGHEVIVADNFFTGRKRNVEHWIGHENFELIHHDIVNPLYIEVDEIYHLASPASPPHYMLNAVKTLKTNTVGTVNMLGKCSLLLFCLSCVKIIQ